MDSKVMEMIDMEIKRLPSKGRRNVRCRQYEDGKNHLFRVFRMSLGHEEYEYICKAVAQKYDV